MFALRLNPWRAVGRRARAALGLFWYAQAVTLGWDGTPTAARRALDRAIGLGGDGPRVRRARAGHLRKLGRPAEAEAELGHVLRLRPDHLPSLRARAEVRAALQLVEEAEQDLDA